MPRWNLDFLSRSVLKLIMYRRWFVLTIILFYFFHGTFPPFHIALYVKYFNCEIDFDCDENAKCVMSKCTCSPGYYGPGKTCSACNEGTWSTATGITSADTCVNCNEGSWSAVPGATSCINCSAGSWSATDGATSIAACRSCNAGYWSDLVGATVESVCNRCNAGLWSSSGASSCNACSAGTWSSEEGATSQLACTECNAGTWVYNDGSTSKSDCVTSLSREFHPSVLFFFLKIVHLERRLFTIHL